MRRSPKQTSQKPEFRAWCAFASFRVVNAPGARCEGDVAIQKKGSLGAFNRPPTVHADWLSQFADILAMFPPLLLMRVRGVCYAGTGR